MTFEKDAFERNAKVFFATVLTYGRICVIIYPNKNDYDRGAPKEEYLCRAVLAGLGRVKGRGAEGPEAKGVPGRTVNIRATVAEMRWAIRIIWDR